MVVASCGGAGNDPAAEATDPSTTASPTTATSTTASPTTGASSIAPGQELDDPFGAAGISVTAIDAPAVGEGMTFTDWQADNLLRAARAGAGRTGTQLRETYTLPADVVPIDHVVAAWLLESTSVAADGARGLLPAATSDILDAAVLAGDASGTERAVYPDAVLALFIQDAITTVGADTAGLLQSSFVSPARIDVCSTLVTFYEGAMTAVFELLEEAIGPWAVQWGQRALGLLPTAGVINIPKKADELGVFQALGLVLSLAGAISPWTTTLTVEPGDVVDYGVAPGVGNEATARVVVDPGLSVEWPAALKSCADLVGLTLPPLDPVGATVDWTPEFNGHATEFDRFVVIQSIDGRYESTLKFRTAVESAQQAAGTPVEGLMSVQAAVARPGDQTFRSIVEKVVERALGSGVIASVLQSVLGDLVATLDEINNPAPMYAFVNARFHEPPEEPTPTDPPSTGPTTTSGEPQSACVGPVLISEAAGGMPGGVRLQMKPNGTLVFDFNGSDETVDTSAGIEVRTQLAGTIRARWVGDGDTFSTNSTRVDVGGIVTVGGVQTALTPDDLAGIAGGETGETLRCTPEGSIVVERTGQVYS
jgi:hypothetical protein